jgi:hypothetical protein
VNSQGLSCSDALRATLFRVWWPAFNRAMIAIVWNGVYEVSGWSCYFWILSNILQVQGGPMYSCGDSHLDPQKLQS